MHLHFGVTSIETQCI